MRSGLSKTKGLSRNLMFQYRKFRTESRQRIKTRTDIDQIYSQRPDEGTQALLGNLNHEAPVNYTASAKILPPEWVDIYEDVTEQLEQIEGKLEELKKMQGASLRTSFGIDTASENVSHLGHDIVMMIRNCEDGLKKLNAMKSRNSLPVVDNVQKVLARKLQLLALRQRQMQKTYMIEMQNLKGDTDISGITETERTNTNEALDSLPDETDAFEFAAMERSKEINEMVENLTELGTIFKELNTLVVEQGTVLDRIDYNIEQGVKHTEDAVVQLEAAEKHQKSMRSTFCIIILVTLILIFAILYGMKLFS